MCSFRSVSHCGHPSPQTGVQGHVTTIYRTDDQVTVAIQHDGNNDPDDKGVDCPHRRARTRFHATSTASGAQYPDSELGVFPGVGKRVRIDRNGHVLAGAEVRDATLERTAVFPGATIRDSTIHRSLVDEHAHVTGIDHGDARLGAYSHLVNEVDGASGDRSQIIPADAHR